mgnify:CR=1 FL=1
MVTLVLHDARGDTCRAVTSATQVGRALYLGTLAGDHVCALDLQGGGEGEEDRGGESHGQKAATTFSSIE